MTEKRGRPRKDRRSSDEIIEPDLLPALMDLAKQLETEFGFRPTLSQTIRHLIKKLANNEADHAREEKQEVQENREKEQAQKDRQKTGASTDDH